MFTAGILEEMFSGYGFEYLYFDSDKPWAAGFEIFDVTKEITNFNLVFLIIKILSRMRISTIEIMISFHLMQRFLLENI